VSTRIWTINIVFCRLPAPIYCTQPPALLDFQEKAGAREIPIVIPGAARDRAPAPRRAVGARLPRATRQLGLAARRARLFVHPGWPPAAVWRLGDTYIVFEQSPASAPTCTTASAPA